MFAIVDIETCGSKFEFRRGRIIEICIVIHDGMQVMDKYTTLINPECNIASMYTKISGIDNEMVANAPKFHEVAADILHYLKDKIFVAHNVGFDYGFVKDEFASLGYKFKADTLCTVKLSRKLLPGKKSYSLGNLCSSLNIEIENRHRAEGDAVATAKLFDLLLMLKTQNASYKTKSLQQIMTGRTENIKKYILNKLPAATGVYYFLDKNKQILYIGKSIDMYQRAISHFNTDLKKTKELLYKLYDVDYIETGNELIALLLESHEIKKHKPFYNTSRKKDVFTHAITLQTYNNILSLDIVPNEDNEHTIASFTSYAAAREKLEQWMHTYTLCMSYCGLSDINSLCMHHQIKLCNGVCAGVEDIEIYNERVNKLLQSIGHKYKSFLILDRGRNENEFSFVWIQNKDYKGYGYMDKDVAIHSQEDIMDYVCNTHVYADDNDLIKSWMRQNPHAKLKIIEY